MERKTLGEQLRKKRMEQGLTAEEISKLCGFSRSYITLIESGKRLLGRKNISKIAVALKIETGVVLNWYLDDVSSKMRNDLRIKK